jgi:LacI family transcriptional regulator
LIRGIAKYSSLNGPWNFLKTPAFFVSETNKTFLSEIKHFDPDGIIMREVQDTQEIIKLAKPVVISPHLHKRYAGALNIVEDGLATGRMAADHLLSKGLRNFAFCGFDDMFWSRERCEGFCDRIAQRGFTSSVYCQPKMKKDRIWENEKASLKDWLVSLPKPVGLMCCIDERSDHVVEVCKMEGIHIPNEIAVIGVDNDDMICELSTPPLSSVSFNADGIGYQAAKMLDGLMKGQIHPDQEELVASPNCVVQRQSTDITAVNDPDIIEAISFIRKNAGKPLAVDDVIHMIAIPRRTLERRFLKFTGNSIYKEIQIERQKRIENLLIETNMTIAEIAFFLGFSEPYDLTRFFIRQRKMSPTSFRKKFKLGIISHMNGENNS